MRAAIAALCLAALGAGTAAAHEGHTTGPHPTPTAGPPLPPQLMLFRVRPEAHADLGFTGISHAQEWPAEQRIGFAALCRAGEDTCAATGGKPGDFFGSPIPLSSGGVPACIVNRLRAGVTGQVQPKLGCAQLQLQLTATVFTGEELTRPCPQCTNDPTPNDGKRDGTCVGGATDGAPCDGNGKTKHFGTISNDCLPTAGRNVGNLALDLPLTTGDATLRAGLTCKIASGKDAVRCFCPAQVSPNVCLGGRCGNREQCDEGPISGYCSLVPARGCRPGSKREDCDALAPGSGECVTIKRPCFRETLPVAGRCDVARPTYAAAFCVPATNAAALNAVAGLPGPARVVLPLERLAPPP